MAGSEDKGPIVVALGGNAISPEEEVDTIENQFAHTGATAKRIARLVAAGWERIVVSHGNGPQVGNVVRRVEHAREIAPWLPLDICVADTQGGMGYMIQQCLLNALRDEGVSRLVATLVTQVVVDGGDPAFGNPTKPIGPSRRLVPSPIPLRVVEAEAIRMMVLGGVIVVAGGGGGVPVVEDSRGLRGVEAVVDKDLTAQLIASAVGATTFVMLTDIDGAYLDYGGERARRLGEVKVAELRSMSAGGAFPPGSMGPKVEAACRFVEGGGEAAIIAALDDLEGAVAGSAGTRVVQG